jgi:hypothetical protein
MEREEVRRQLDKILSSSAFSYAPRAQLLLRFVVEEKLAGRASEVNEAALAERVFNLAADSDRSGNSIIRTEAAHVRRRLRTYYRGEGGADSVIIGLPRWGYVPSLRTRGGSWRRLGAFLSRLWPGESAPSK